jgi:hypothetical protein
MEVNMNDRRDAGQVVKPRWAKDAKDAKDAETPKAEIKVETAPVVASLSEAEQIAELKKQIKALKGTRAKKSSFTCMCPNVRTAKLEAEKEALEAKLQKQLAKLQSQIGESDPQGFNIIPPTASEDVS